MKKKWTPHIIAAAALAVFIVLGLASATAPKAPEVIVYDPAIPEDQTATLFIQAGWYEVTHFNRKKLKENWYQPSITNSGIDVKIPAGRNSMLFNRYGGELRTNIENIDLEFNVVAGRRYMIKEESPDDHTSRIRRLSFSIMEIWETREPRPDEQLLIIKRDGDGGGLIILDKNTDDERSLLYFVLGGENRFIVSKGEHTIDFELPEEYIENFGSALEPTVEPQRNFAASSEPVKYLLNVKRRGSGKNTKTTYALTRQ
jgi:hypothetical protein